MSSTTVETSQEIRKVSLFVMGDEYRVISEASEQQLMQAASSVESELKGVLNKARGYDCSEKRLYTLAALGLALEAQRRDEALHGYLDQLLTEARIKLISEQK